MRALLLLALLASTAASYTPEEQPDAQYEMDESPVTPAEPSSESEPVQHDAAEVTATSATTAEPDQHGEDWGESVAVETEPQGAAAVETERASEAAPAAAAVETEPASVAAPAEVAPPTSPSWLSKSKLLPFGPALRAARPWSFSASVTPVLYGAALAFKEEDAFSPLVLGLSLLTAVSVHAAGNLVNTYVDHVKGVDGSTTSDQTIVGGALRY